MKRRIIFLIIIFILLGGWYVSGRSTKKQKLQTIETSRVTRGDFTNTVSSSGKTKASKSVDLKFQTSGKLSWVGVKEGDTVRQYQALASMDTREVRKGLEKALRDYSSERNDFEETRTVTYGGITPNQALTDTVKRILQKNQWDLEKAVLDVELKNLAVEFSTLVTPISGLVTHVDTPIAGVNITPASAVFTVADPSSLIFEANIDEIDVGQLSVGQLAIVNLDAFPEVTFSGTVNYISYISQTSSGGATVFPVKISLDIPQQLRIGLNGDVTIELEKQENALMVPVEAIRDEGKEKYVYRNSGTAYEKITVVVSSQNDDVAIIESGLSDGEMVVTKGFANIPNIK